jgi:small ligand-binding sensory domain FIST
MHVMDTEPGAENGGCYVSALSEHPDPTQAAADVTAEVLERVGRGSKLAVLFVTPPHRDAVGDIADVVRSVLQPITLRGAAAEAVLGPRREVEEPPGVSLFAARLGSPAVPVRLHADATGQGWQISDLPSAVAGAWDLRVCVDDNGARGVLRSSAS